MVSRAVTSFALGLAVLACDGAKSTPSAAAEPAANHPAETANGSHDADDASVGSDGPLDGARNGMVNNIAGTPVSEKQIEFAGHPARASAATASADGNPLRIEAPIFFAEPQLYQVLVVRAESERFPAPKFFDSFSLLGE